MTDSTWSKWAAWPGLWAVALVTGVGLSLAVVLEALPDETPVIVWLQTHIEMGESLFELVRLVTGSEGVVAVGALIIVVHLAKGDREGALVLIVLLVLLLVTQWGLKQLIDRPRPSPGEIEVMTTFSSASFPSGHLMSTTIGYGWLAAMGLLSGSEHVLVRYGPLTLAVGLVVLTGVSSLYTGVHWPTDVLGGFCWGLVMLLPAVTLYARLRRR